MDSSRESNGKGCWCLIHFVSAVAEPKSKSLKFPHPPFCFSSSILVFFPFSSCSDVSRCPTLWHYQRTRGLCTHHGGKNTGSLGFRHSNSDDASWGHWKASVRCLPLPSSRIRTQLLPIGLQLSTPIFTALGNWPCPVPIFRGVSV